MATRVVDVLVPVALDQTYSYRVPAGLDLSPGDLVAVPLGARGETLGVVWADNPNPNPRLHNRLKDVDEKLDIPPLKPELRKFVDWVADYTLASRGMVLRMALRMGEHLGPGRERVGVRRVGPPPQRMTPARARVLALFADGLTRSKGEAAQEAGVSGGVIDGLIDEGTLETLVLPPRAGGAATGSGFPQARFRADAAGRGRRAAHHCRPGRLHRHAARRRYRLRQDRSLFRGRCREHPQEPAGADPDAGNRAHRAVPRPLRRALRRTAGGVAFAAQPTQTRAYLGGGGGKRSLGGGRRALGAVSALRRSRPDHRR